MKLRTIVILILLAVGTYYTFYVKGFNPFATKIEGDITLYTLDGKTTTLNEMAGNNGAFIFYMTTWCSVCLEEIKQLKTLNGFLQKKDIQVIVCIGGDTRDEIHNWKYRQDFPWNWKTVYWQEELRNQFQLKKNAVPYMIARNNKGKVIFSAAGGFPGDYITDIALKMLDSNH